MAIALILAALAVGVLVAIVVWPLGWVWLVIAVPVATSLCVLIGAVLIAYGRSRGNEADGPVAQTFHQVLTKLHLR